MEFLLSAVGKRLQSDKIQEHLLQKRTFLWKQCVQIVINTWIKSCAKLFTVQRVCVCVSPTATSGYLRRFQRGGRCRPPHHVSRWTRCSSWGPGALWTETVCHHITHLSQSIFVQSSLSTVGSRIGWLSFLKYVYSEVRLEFRGFLDTRHWRNFECEELTFLYFWKEKMRVETFEPCKVARNISLRTSVVWPLTYFLNRCSFLDEANSEITCCCLWVRWPITRTKKEKPQKNTALLHSPSATMNHRGMLFICVWVCMGDKGGG